MTLPEGLTYVPGLLTEAEERDVLAVLLVTRYPSGAGIGWHRDAPQFGEVSGVSLLTACRMRFRRGRPVVSGREGAPRS